MLDEAKATGSWRQRHVVMLGECGKPWYAALRSEKLLAETAHSTHAWRGSSRRAMSFGTLDLAPSGD